LKRVTQPECAIPETITHAFSQTRKKGGRVVTRSAGFVRSGDANTESGERVARKKHPLIIQVGRRDLPVVASQRGGGDSLRKKIF